MPNLTERSRMDFAKMLVKVCFRNDNPIENIHAGRTPKSVTGDFSDVSVHTPTQVIPWNELSRISQDEMKAIMKAAVNNVYTLLTGLELGGNCFHPMLSVPDGWDDPEIYPAMLYLMTGLED